MSGCRMIRNVIGPPTLAARFVNARKIMSLMFIS